MINSTAFVRFFAVPAAVAAALGCVILYIDGLSAKARLRAQTELADLLSMQLKAQDNQLEAERIISARQAKLLQEKITTLDAASDNVTRGETPRLSFKEMRIFTLRGSQSDMRAVVVWDGIAHQGMLDVDSAPASTSAETYRLIVFSNATEKPVLEVPVVITPETRHARVAFRTPEPIGEIRQITLWQLSHEGSNAVQGRLVLRYP